MNLHEPIIVNVSFPDQESAIQISKYLLENKLVACTQISPIESYYTWQGKFESSKEYKASLKTVYQFWPKIEQTILQKHPYEVPEILAVPMIEVTKAYLEWMLAELGLSGKEIDV
jgi:periplasmic divalent cation tolerance protein